MSNRFTAIYTKAEESLKELEKDNIKKVFRTVSIFEEFGKDGVNCRILSKDGLFEMKIDNIRIYFSYCKDKIIIIGLVVLKKSQKAPKKYIENAKASIERYKRSSKNE